MNSGFYVPDEKEQQVRDQLEVIRYWENEEDRLRKVIESF